MAWDSNERRSYERWGQFGFFKTGGADGAFSESVNIDKRIRLEEVRVHFSVAFAETEDLTVRLSSTKGSAYNQVFGTIALSDLTDVRFIPSAPIEVLSDDELVIAFSMASGTNVYGVEAIGWEVTG